MADFTGFIETIRKTTLETVERSKPSGIYFGKVISVCPIQINVDQRLILTEEFIVLGRYITEFSIDYTIEGEMWHGLRKGDELLLVREQGGQRYCVIDWVKRIEEDTRPAWITEGEIVSIDPLEIKVNDYLTLKKEQLILCHSVTNHLAYLSFDNPSIKQKVQIYDKAEKETLLGSVRASEEPHPICPDDIPLPVVETTTDIQFVRKAFDEGSLPAYHEVTIYNRFEVGDRVMLACERSLQKWFVVDFTYQVKQEKAWWI